MKKLSLVVVFLFASYSLIFAQEKEEKLPYKRWEIGVNAGVANFAGSTNMSKDHLFGHFKDFKSDIDFGYGLFVRKNFTNVFALEGAYNGTTLTGTPKAGFVGYNSFKTGINEFDLNTVWNINNLFSKNKFDRKVYWFAKVGAGITHVNNKKFTDATVQGDWRYWTIPIGTGLSFRLSDNVKLNLGTQWSWVNTNRLDGVNQGGYGTDFLIGQIREQYLYTSAGLSVMLGKKPVKPVVCPCCRSAKTSTKTGAKTGAKTSSAAACT